MSWATFWAIFSQTHLVTLELASTQFFENRPQKAVFKGA
jgi:hypothetical protein